MRLFLELYKELYAQRKKKPEAPRIYEEGAFTTNFAKI
jgi:hypothetical protein